MENAPAEKPDQRKSEKSSDDKEEKRFIVGRAAVRIEEPKREVPPPPPPESKKEDDKERPSWFLRPEAESEVKSAVASQPAAEAPMRTVIEKATEDEIESGEDSVGEAVSEEQAPSDGTLGAEEIKTVIRNTAEEEAEKVPEYDPAKDQAEALGDVGTAVFYEEAAASGDQEAALQKAAEVIGVDASELQVELPAEAEPGSDAEVELPDGESEIGEAETEAEEIPEVLSIDHSSEAAGPAPEAEDEDDPLASAGGGSTGGPGSTAGSASGGGSPSGAAAAGGPGGPGGGPGAVPTGRGGPGAPGGPFGPVGGGARTPGYNPFSAPGVPYPAPRMERNYDIDDRASPAAMALAGGIIGYLLGRRRGRIKTEKRLLPVQKKLEKQVEGLNWQLKAKEQAIRKAAREKVQQQGPAVVETAAAAAVAAKAARRSERTAAPVTRQETPAAVRERLVREPRQRAPEARQLHGKKSPERIGHMLMAAESVPPVRLERTQAETMQRPKLEKQELSVNGRPATERSVESLNRQELLQLSEQIVVEGSTLRQIYETRLVGERGLRRLIAEHLRGGDLKKALKQEIVEREIDFERDPVMRDLSPSKSGGGQSGGPVGGGRTALDQMVQKAAATLPASSEEAAFYKARAAYEVDQSNRQKKKQQILDISLTTIIVVLFGLVIFFAIIQG